MSGEPSQPHAATSRLDLTLDAPLGDAALDAVYAALGDARRRRIVLALDRLGEPIGVEELAACLADRDARTDPGGATASDRRSVQLSLYHSQLPKLADAGVVEYDPEEGTVRRGTHHALARKLVETTLA